MVITILLAMILGQVIHDSNENKKHFEELEKQKIEQVKTNDTKK